MKLVAITGTSSGIGKAIADSPPDQFETFGLNRNGGPGLPDPNYMKAIFEYLYVIDPDVFVNNAYGGSGTEFVLGQDPNPQLSLFMSVLELWKGRPEKTIINIGSMAALYAPGKIDSSRPEAVEWHRRYRRNKEALLRASEQAAIDTNNVFCRVSAISPGYVLTERTAGPQHANVPKMLPVEFAEYVWWLIRQPQVIRIPHLSVYAVDLNGRGP